MRKSHINWRHTKKIHARNLKTLKRKKVKIRERKKWWKHIDFSVSESNNTSSLKGGWNVHIFTRKGKKKVLNKRIKKTSCQTSSFVYCEIFVWIISSHSSSSTFNKHSIVLFSCTPYRYTVYITYTRYYFNIIEFSGISLGIGWRASQYKQQCNMHK